MRTANLASFAALVPALDAFSLVNVKVKPLIGMSTETSLNAEILMPALSSTMKKGKVVSWLKSEGDTIEAGEAIMVVESDKADMDVEAFEDGVLAKILVGEGEMAPVGNVVALVADSESEINSVVSAFQAGCTASESIAATAATTSAHAAGKNVVRQPIFSQMTRIITYICFIVSTPTPDIPFSQIDMPALSSTMKEGKVVSWLKSEGDFISSGEAIMVVESDKADMDVEAFEDGFLAAILTAEGESGAVGAPVALIAENECDVPILKEYAGSLSAGGAVAVASAATASAPAPLANNTTKSAISSSIPATTGDHVVASPLARKLANERGIVLSSITGTGPNGRITAADVDATASGGGTKATVPTKSSWVPAPGVIAATPMARALSKKLKLDLSTIAGTGEFGRVTADDVKTATGEKKPKRKKVGGTIDDVELPTGIVAMSGMQRAVCGNMMATMASPSFQVSRYVEMDSFDALYQSLKPLGVSVSVLLIKAVALAIEKNPIVNSAYSDKDGGSIEYKDNINIAMAVAIDGGLITPCMENANERSVLEMAEHWKGLVGKCKSGTLTPAEYTSGTFTISNMGMFGVHSFGSLLSYGMGAILAVGGTEQVIVPDDQSVLGMKKVKRMSVTLTADHRHIYGVDSALFLKELANVIENPPARLSE